MWWIIALIVMAIMLVWIVWGWIEYARARGESAGWARGYTVGLDARRPRRKRGRR